MARLSLNLDERSLRQGMAHIRLRINHRGTSAFVGTGVYVEPEYFIAGSLYDCVHRKARMAIEKREQVARVVQKYEELILDIGIDRLRGMSANDIRNAACTPAPTHTHIEKPRLHSSANFVQVLCDYGGTRQTVNSRKSYEYAWHVLKEYCDARNLITLPIDTIDYARLTDFARWLKSSGRGENTRHMMESYVRAAYKDAQKRRLVSRDLDPYFDYSIAPVPAKDIDCLTTEEMKKLVDADLSACAGIERARDIALVSFYLCGANLLDIYDMDAPKHGEVVFIRHKVENHYQRPIHIRIEPELAELLKKHCGKTKLLACAETSNNYDTFQRRVTRLLKQVGKKTGVDVTMAKIRRTWPTIAASLDIPDRVIDKSMGHVDSSIKDKHYEQYDWSRTAIANRKVIDYVLNGIE